MTTPMEPFKRIITKLETLADSLGLDMLQPGFFPDMEGENDVLQVAFVVRPETTDEMLADNLAFDDIVAGFDTTE